MGLYDGDYEETKRRQQQSQQYRADYTQAETEVFWTFRRVLFAGVFFLCVIGLIGFVLSFFGDAAKVTQEQFSPSVLLEKYEWFKDASAQLDKKQADITVYESRFKSLSDSYSGIPRANWGRDDREQFNIWQSEVAGIKASYNSLAADYNSQMSKFNYRFTNVGDLPKGADKPLTREYKPYIGE